MNKVTTMAIDLAKDVFQVAAENALGEELWQKRLGSRKQFETFLGSLEAPLCIGMEAGLGTQAWARQLSARGFDVRVLPAQRVAEHRSGAKNDCNDARAILHALRDRSIHAIPIKTVEQLTMQALHRARAGWAHRKTALGNQMRGLLLEHGIVIAQGEKALRDALTKVLEAPHGVTLPARLRDLLAELEGEWKGLDERITKISAELTILAREDPVAQQLATIPGVGPLTATAMVCKNIDPSRFRHARFFAAYIGPVPDQNSSGKKVRVGRMSRRGDSYLRSLLVNGAHAVIRTTREDATDADRQRVLRWKHRHGNKGAAIRLANHNLRLIWALLQHHATYQCPLPAPPGRAATSGPERASLRAGAAGGA